MHRWGTDWRGSSFRVNTEGKSEVRWSAAIQGQVGLVFLTTITVLPCSCSFAAEKGEPSELDPGRRVKRFI